MILKRVISGIVVAALSAIVLRYMPGPVQFAILAAIVAACQLEYAAIAKGAGGRPYRTFNLFVGLAWLCVAYVFGKTSEPFVAGAAVVAGFAIALRTLFDAEAKNALATAALNVLGFLYIPVMLSFLLRLAQVDAEGRFATTRSGVFLVFFTASVVKFSDTGAFSFGVPFGRHKMFPRISPKKSWEGLAGGVLFGVGLGLALAAMAAKFQWGPAGVFYSADPAIAPRVTLPVAAAISLGLVVVGLFGDLFESMFKRSAAVKDSASVIPGGMGGLLDVMDSIVFAAPFAYYVFA